jgi:hypothetical protein
MKTLIQSFFAVALLFLISAVELHGQGSVFTFQGRLNDTNGPLNTNAAMIVRIYAVSSGGAALWQETQSSVPVTNGLFSVALGQSVPVDASILNGNARWLGISVNGNAELTPRIQITAAPYAITAGNLTGVVPASGLSGTYSGALTFNNPGNAFNGNGVGLTSLSASQLTSGTVPTAALSNTWKVGGNAGTTPGTHFLGTTDNRALEIRVNSTPAFRIEPGAAPNIVGGSASSVVVGRLGAVIGGGANQLIEADYATISGGQSNTVSDVHGTVGGGVFNLAGGGSAATVAGGFANVARGQFAAVGGGRFNSAIGFVTSVNSGQGNSIETNSDHSVIGGGLNNLIHSFSPRGVIAGGGGNEIGVNSKYPAISGGQENHIGDSADYATIGGGFTNTIDSPYSTIGGGTENKIGTISQMSFVGGGWRNNIQTNSDQSAIVGGNSNTIQPGSRESFIGGGFANAIGTGGLGSFVGGGFHNTNVGYASFIGGGNSNDIRNDSDYGAIGGGSANDIGTNSPYSSIGGGQNNTISANSLYATIPGGENNRATNYAFAAGRRAKANHTGSFVWGDSQNADFASTGTNQFLIRAQGGVGIGTSDPKAFLHVTSAGSAAPQLHLEQTVNNDFARLRFTSTNKPYWDIAVGGANNVMNFYNSGSGNVMSLTTNGDLITAGTINGTIANNAITSAQIIDGSVFAADVNPATFSTTFWKADGNAGTTAGTHFLGTTDSQPLELKVNSLRVLRLEPGVGVSGPNVVGGAVNNQVVAGVSGATIAGGRQNAIGSQADGGTIGGGWINTVAAGANLSTVAGGIRNTAGGITAPGFTVASTVGGGDSNFADAPYATIGGGLFNTNTGFGATIPGGRDNVASGSSSFAAGRRAKANHMGSFVWGDSQNADFASTGTNQFLIRAEGGVGINLTNPLHRLHVGVTRGTNAFNASTNVIAIEDAEEDGRATFLALAGIGGPDTTNRVELQMEAVESSRRGIIGTTTEHPLYLRVGNSDVMLLATNRFVGIGETDPQARLHVTSSGSASPQLHLEQTVNNDFARVRLTSAPKPSWDIAVGGAANVMNFFNPTNGNVMTLTTNGNLTTAGTVNGVSDRAAKTRFRPVNNREILERVAELPLARWEYKTDPGVPHLGPVAQDFHAAFGLGTDDKHIATVDADGVALAAIQGLNQKFEERLKEKDAELESLKQQLAELQELITTRIAKGNDL